ncbi:hypothetical protein ABT381_04790 [Streptomyces sp. NPDC000151]|uniref:hypothetical protein n=1 Tax=Streptomyces sp. NPDC000151 TaxID=3154244 RepID=UPI003318DE3C
MTSAARKQGQGREHRFINAQGSEVKTRDEAFAAQRDVSAEALRVTAKMRLNNGALTFDMEVTYNPNTYPHVVTGGRITSGICGAPWDITGGELGPRLVLRAARPGGSGTCAQSMTVVGQFQVPLSYRGTYGFNGQSASFPHTTQYLC